MTMEPMDGDLFSQTICRGNYTILTEDARPSNDTLPYKEIYITVTRSTLNIHHGAREFRLSPLRELGF